LRAKEVLIFRKVMTVFLGYLTDEEPHFPLHAMYMTCMYVHFCTYIHIYIDRICMRSCLEENRE